jgi:hypothetical protein
MRDATLRSFDEDDLPCKEGTLLMRMSTTEDMP